MWIGLRNLRVRAFATLLTVLVVGVATAIALVVPVTLRQLDRGATEAVQVFDLLVTAKGSPTQAVLSSLFYLDVPIGNMPYDRYRMLADDPRTRRAVPLGFGDTYRGHPIVGTTEAFFTLQLQRDGPPYFRLRQGQVFDGPFEAVVGAQVAQTYGLRIGDTFTTTHGLVFVPGIHDDEHVTDAHDHAPPASDGESADRLSVALRHGPPRHLHAPGNQRSIVGLAHLPPSVTLGFHDPFAPHAHRDDRHDEGTHDHDDLAAARSAIVRLQQALADATTDADRQALRIELNQHFAVLAAAVAADDHDDTPLGHGHAEEYVVVGLLEPTGGPVDRALLVDIESLWLVHGQISSANRGVTAVLYSAERVADYYAVAQELDASPDAQAVFTGAVFAQIRGFVAQGEAAYGALSLLVLALATLTLWLNIYAGALERRRSVALLRALGARRRLIFGLVLVETALTITIGVVLGIGLSIAIAGVGAGLLSAALGFVLPPPVLDPTVVGRVLLLIPLGLLAALIPAVQAMRASPLKYL